MLPACCSEVQFWMSDRTLPDCGCRSAALAACVAGVLCWCSW